MKLQIVCAFEIVKACRRSSWHIDPFDISICDGCSNSHKILEVWSDSLPDSYLANWHSYNLNTNHNNTNVMGHWLVFILKTRLLAVFFMNDVAIIFDNVHQMSIKHIWSRRIESQQTSQPHHLINLLKNSWISSWWCFFDEKKTFSTSAFYRV